MKVHTATCLIVAFLLSGPDVLPQRSGSKQNYPAMIKDSADQRAKAERDWRRMLDSYGVPQTPPDLHPIIDTPRSLLGVSGGIKLLGATPEPGTETFALRQAMKQFIDRWRDLLGADPKIYPDPASRAQPDGPHGLSAVIEDISGGTSYWALAHPPGKPDFHHADGFALEFSPAVPS